MLNDHERETLREVERRILAEDPEFARSFQARQELLVRVHRVSVTAVVIGAAMLLSILLMVAGSMMSGLAFAAMTWLIWFTWRHTDTSTDTSADGSPWGAGELE